jgi:hypothetical protein
VRGRTTCHVITCSYYPDVRRLRSQSMRGHHHPVDLALAVSRHFKVQSQHLKPVVEVISNLVTQNRVSVAHRPQNFPILANFSIQPLHPAGRVHFLPQPRGKASKRALADEVSPDGLCAKGGSVVNRWYFLKLSMKVRMQVFKIEPIIWEMPSERLPTNTDGVKSAKTMFSTPEFNETSMKASMYVTGHL